MNNTNTSAQTSATKNANEWQKREIGALWKRVSSPSSSYPKGRTYLTGKLKIDELGEEKTVNVVVFSNVDKKNDKAPDFRIYISKDANERAAAAAATTTNGAAVAAKTVAAAAPGRATQPAVEVDEEIL